MQTNEEDLLGWFERWTDPRAIAHAYPDSVIIRQPRGSRQVIPRFIQANDTLSVTAVVSDEDDVQTISLEPALECRPNDWTRERFQIATLLASRLGIELDVLAEAQWRVGDHQIDLEVDWDDFRFVIRRSS